MGWDATFYFPPGTKRRNAEHFLTLIGYKTVAPDRNSRESKTTLFFLPPNDDPARLSSVTATIYVEADATLVAASRTNIWATHRDTELQNTMLHELKDYFGGHFVSDFGKNRYFKNTSPKRIGVEAACFAAAFHFLNSIVSVRFLNSWVADKSEQKPTRERNLAWTNQMNPSVLTANLGTVHFVSLIEDFFKSVFVSTLRYSKEAVNLNRFRSIRPLMLERAYQGQIALEEAIAESRSFQNADSIRQNFSGLPFVGFIDKYLAKTVSSKSQIRRAAALQRIFDRRHNFVHQAEIDLTYLSDDLMRDIRFCERLVFGLYKGLTRENNWPYEDPR